MFGNIDLNTALQIIVILLASVTLHEFAHAVAADRLGDPTPRRNGQLSLNPAVHMEPIGMLFMVLAALNSFLFAWGRTFINPQNLRWGPQRGGAVVAAAGPVTNLLLSIVLALTLKIVLATSPSTGAPLPFLGESLPSHTFYVAHFLEFAVEANLFLFLFNLIPIPPLDGFSIVSGFLTPRQLYTVAPLVQYAPIVFLVFVLISLQTNFIQNDVVGPLFTPAMGSGTIGNFSCSIVQNSGVFSNVLSIPSYYHC